MNLNGFKFFKGASVNENLCTCLLNDNSVGEQLNGACVVDAGQIYALNPQRLGDLQLGIQKIGPVAHPQRVVQNQESGHRPGPAFKAPASHVYQKGIKQYCRGQRLAPGPKILAHRFIVSGGVIALEQPDVKALFCFNCQKPVEQVRTQAVAYSLVDLGAQPFLDALFHPVFQTLFVSPVKPAEIKPCRSS